MINSEELSERMVQYFAQVPTNKWSYFHKKTMDNFVYHLPNIPNEFKRIEIAEKIKLYLEEIETWPMIDIIEVDISTCEYLYHTHVKNLINFYDLNLEFVPVFGKKANIIIIPALAGMFYILWNKKILITILTVIAAIYWGRIIYKAFERKLYGFGY